VGNRKQLESRRDLHGRAAAFHEGAALLHDSAAARAAERGELVREAQQRNLPDRARRMAEVARGREARIIEALTVPPG
jgi:hypothetical protein